MGKYTECCCGEDEPILPEPDFEVVVFVSEEYEDESEEGLDVMGD